VTEKDDFENLSGAFALDAVSPEERAAVEKALASSESLRAEAGELADTAAALADAVQPVQPSAGLKDAIFAQLDATPQLPREERAPDAVVEPSAAPDPAGPAQERARTRWFRRPAVLVTAVAAAAALVVGGITVPLLINGTTQQQDPFAAIASASDAQTVTTAVANGGTATVVWSGELGRAAIELEGATPLDESSDYELWFMGDDGTRSAGLVQVDATGDARQELAGEMGAGDIIGLTVEPAGGSPQPTGDPILAVPTA
jgi:anti-sigma-K factor RskA